MGRRRRAILVGLACLVALTGIALGTALVVGRDDDEDASADPSTTSTAPTTSTTSATSTTAARGELGSGQAVTIAFAGDMNFEGSLRPRLEHDPSSVLGPFAAELQGADLAVGNLEAAIATGGRPEVKDFTFRAPPRAIDALRAAGFDTVSLANNHALDYGPDGLAETLAVKRAQPDGFVIGVGADEDEAFAPFTTVVKGQRISVIAATQVIDRSLVDAWTASPGHGGVASAKHVDRLVAEVARARATSDTVVVFLHWGTERMSCPNDPQRSLARRLVDAGADVVVGGHAHRLQGAGRLDGAFVAYGLGNFLFRSQSPEAARTGVLRVTVTGRRIDAYDWSPGRIEGSVPRPLDGAAAVAARADWDGLRSCTGLSA